ncbi:GNAT family N-acetyltransferase [Marininema halotolerans]|uniref:N-acetyltransferase domain-containing protein n=1 Tax=Marininema halotolerans TaxID=1155944 RepID=A0A1I6THR8_9BACL|nr:GNAT family N-acetyltransferase [Marininema halotolerans]SFS88715.1 hypothetical protein SAMN05444972_11023 [Marininema halotolerans]
MQLRHLQESDYPVIISVLNDWWGGRPMSDMLPRLFFRHFEDTSFIVEEEDRLVGFLVGFISPSHRQEAYIHFVGVHPDYRAQGVARRLYQQFEERVLKQFEPVTIRCVTSPVNKSSIAFHQKVGFTIIPGSVVQEGISIHPDYDGQGQDRVVFQKTISCIE